MDARLPPDEVSDRMLISDLLDAYAAAIDAKDWDLLTSVFAPEAVLDYTASGGPKDSLDEVVAWLEASLAPFTMTQHLITNRRIIVDGDSATSRAYFFNPLGRPDGRGGLDLLFVGGFYNDRLRRADGGWRIVERVLEIAWFRGALPEGISLRT